MFLSCYVIRNYALLRDKLTFYLYLLPSLSILDKILFNFNPICDNLRNELLLFSKMAHKSHWSKKKENYPDL